MKVLIIGGVATGMSAAAKIKREMPKAEVRVYEKAKDISYGACGLPYYIGDVNKDENLLRIRTIEQFAKSGIEVFNFCEVLAVKPEEKKIRIQDKDGKIFEDNYDKLVIATGASPVFPDAFKGVKNVFTLKTIDDANSIKDACSNAQNIVIAGGGYIGIELAENFIETGKNVILIEGADRILNTFDVEITEIAEKYLKDNGVTLHTSRMITGIAEKDGKTVVSTSGDMDIEADAVLLCLGVRPNTEFIKDTGIKLALNGAIEVDDMMCSSLPDIYAGGDCACVWHKILNKSVYIPLGTNANKAGRLIGENITGSKNSFYGALGTAMIKILSLEAAATGVNEKQAQSEGIDYAKIFIKAPNHAPYYPNIKDIYVKLIFKKNGGELIGAQTIGADAALRINTLAVCVDQKMKLEDISRMDFGYAPPFTTVWDPIALAASAGLKK